MKNAPAFSKESFITTPMDYLSRISFELSSVNFPGEISQTFSHNWEDVDKTLLQINGFGGQLKRYAFIKEIKEEISRKTNDPTEKMKTGLRVCTAVYEVGRHWWDRIKGRSEKSV